MLAGGRDNPVIRGYLAPTGKKVRRWPDHDAHIPLLRRRDVWTIAAASEQLLFFELQAPVSLMPGHHSLSLRRARPSRKSTPRLRCTSPQSLLGAAPPPRPSPPTPPPTPSPSLPGSRRTPLRSCSRRALSQLSTLCHLCCQLLRAMLQARYLCDAGKCPLTNRAPVLLLVKSADDRHAAGCHHRPRQARRRQL